MVVCDKCKKPKQRGVDNIRIEWDEEFKIPEVQMYPAGTPPFVHKSRYFDLCCSCREKLLEKIYKCTENEEESI